MEKVIFISYLFPPIGGSGVQRRLKFAKYLPKFGWKPYVITVKDIKHYVADNSFLSELCDEVEIHRTGSLDPLRVGRLFMNLISKTLGKKGGGEGSKNQESIPFARRSFILTPYRIIRDWLFMGDFQFLWVPFAYLKCSELIKKENIDIIFSSSGPACHVLAYFLGARFKLPYVLDFSDAWCDDPYRSMPTVFHKMLDQKLESITVRNAAAITVYGLCLKEIFQRKYGDRIGDRTHIIYNGYDAKDISHIKCTARKYDGRIHLVYSGSLYEHQKPCFVSLLNALARLPCDIQQDIHFDIVGNYFSEAKELVAKLSNCDLKTKVEFHGYLPHHEALSLSATASHLVLFIESGNKSMITGKVFEYIGLNKPILCLVPEDGDAAAVLRSVHSEHYHIVEPNDSLKQTEVLKNIYYSPKSEIKPNYECRVNFERSAQTRKLALLFENIVVKQRARLS